MRVLLDTNVLVSYLLATSEDSPALRIVRAAAHGEFILLLPEDLADELTAVVSRKRYLHGHISAAHLRELGDLLGQICEVVPRITERVPAVTRDSKDDYLLACALLSQADYLVTGDDDLLCLGPIDPLLIVSPRDFLAVLAGRS
jgi:uncharacterized protein